MLLTTARMCHDYRKSLTARDVRIIHEANRKEGIAITIKVLSTADIDNGTADFKILETKSSSAKDNAQIIPKTLSLEKSVGIIKKRYMLKVNTTDPARPL